MEIEKLIEWNPWWENPKAIEKLKGNQRVGYANLINSVKIEEITIITGVRRCGKSTLMYQIVDKLILSGINPKQILFVNLEDKKLTDDSLEDICNAYRQNINLKDKAYIFLDEIHNKKFWESWIRKQYDLKTNDKFIISGSCAYLLKKEYSTLLTGRNLTFEVFPLSFEEFLSFKELKINKENIIKNLITNQTKLELLKYFEEYLFIGGFPGVFNKPENYKSQILQQYFDDILYKDIVDRHNINSQKIKDLAVFLSTNFTGFISLRNLRNSLKISYDTIKEYLSYLKDAYLFFTIDHFSYSFKEQKTLASKVYCIDNGIRSSVSFKFSKDIGKLAENCVFLELKRRNKKIYYWKGKNEIDFIVKNDHLIAVNVSYDDNIPERETKGLLEFKKEYPESDLIIITKDIEKEENEIKYIPLWKWLLE